MTRRIKCFLRGHRTLQVLSLIGILALLVGCAAPAATTTGTAEGGSTASSAPSQAVLIIPEEPATLNQYHGDAAIIRQVADAVSAPLAVPNADGEFIPVLAEAIPTLENGGVSEDLKTITWKLRPDLKWSDGEPLTSDDIKFTWEAINDPNSGNVLSLGFNKIESIETPDDLTAILTYSEPSIGYLSQFMYGIMPRHATGAPADMKTWAWNRSPVSAGPFVVTEWNSGETIVMDRNPNYYLEGQPYIDRLIFRIVPDPGAQLAMMAQGEGTVQLWPGENKDVYDAQMDGNAAIQETPGQWNMALYYNLSAPYDGDEGAEPPHPILGDVRVRQALSHAINYDVIYNDIASGTTPIASPFPYGWYRCDIERPYPFDLDKANALLEEAGWVMGSDGVRVAQGAQYAADGTRLTLQLNGYTNFQPLQRLEEALVEMWKQAGIETTIQNDDFSVIFGSYEDGAPRTQGNFDILIYDASLRLDPQATIESSYLSSQIPSAENPEGDNFSRWISPEADALIQQAGATVDLEVRKEAYCELANLIATEMPRLNLFLYTEGYGANNALSGYDVNMWGSLTWDVANWKLQ